MHLLSGAHNFAAKLNEVLYEAYAGCYDACLLQLNGTWEPQEDPDLLRGQFTNAPAIAFLEVMGNGSTRRTEIS